MNTTMASRSLLLKTLAVMAGLAGAWVLGQATVSIAQGRDLDVINARFVRTLTRVADGQTQVIAEGTITVAPSGSRRVDTVENGVRTAEILAANSGRRIALNLSARQAVIGSASGPVLPPSIGPRQVPVGVPDGWSREEQPRQDLGTKTIGVLVVNGTRFSTILRRDGQQMLNVRDVWDYRFPDRSIVPVIMETRFETPDSVDERKIVDASAARVGAGFFEVPHGFSVSSLP